MLPKRNRLKTEDFKDMRKMRTMHAPHFFLRIGPLSSAENKAAVIVGSSTYKKAVDRNLLRRRMYHVLKKHFPLLKGVTTVTFKKGALDLSFRELEAELLTLLK